MEAGSLDKPSSTGRVLSRRAIVIASVYRCNARLPVEPLHICLLAYGRTEMPMKRHKPEEIVAKLFLA